MRNISLVNIIKCIVWWLSFMCVLAFNTVWACFGLLKLYYKLPTIFPLFGSFITLDIENIMNVVIYTSVFMLFSYLLIRLLWWIMGKIADLVVKNNDWASVKTIFPDSK